MASRSPSRVATAALALALAAAGLGAPPAGARSGQLLVRANFAAAMAALPHGGLRYGELSGRIWQVNARGRRSLRPLVTLRVSTAGLNGLLGLVVDRHGRTFAAWTTPARRLVVGKVAPGGMRMVWNGRRAGEEANGGRLAFARDGRLLLSLGDRDRSVVDGPNGPVVPPFPGMTGQIVALNPNGPASQRPQGLARGWFNPFGLAVAPGGAVWVADNAIGDDEHLARADLGPTPAAAIHLPPGAPSGLAAIGDSELALCGFASRRLDRYRIGANGLPFRSGRALATDCSLGVVRLSDGRLAYANQTAIRTLRP
jgi:glucose/arabinose dehydrogenase